MNQEGPLVCGLSDLLMQIRADFTRQLPRHKDAPDAHLADKSGRKSLVVFD
jgi:hypothetical protein